MNAADLAGYLAALLVFVPGARWLYLMQTVRIPADRTLFIAPSAVALRLGVLSLASGPSLSAGILAGVSAFGGAVFVMLCAFSRQVRTRLPVEVGGAILDFCATDDDGRAFDLASLRGRPLLLKFFRGHWCPYCVAELKRWNELEPELARHGIRIVTVCSDNAEQIRRGRTKHGLRATMLPDPDLTITDVYNLRNPKSFAPKPGVIIPLPIPTTILVDAEGVVRWIDQSEDYMVRSEPSRVREAIRAAFGAEIAVPEVANDAAEQRQSAPVAACCS